MALDADINEVWLNKDELSENALFITIEKDFCLFFLGLKNLFFSQYLYILFSMVMWLYFEFCILYKHIII